MRDILHTNTLPMLYKFSIDELRLTPAACTLLELDPAAPRESDMGFSLQYYERRPSIVFDTLIEAQQSLLKEVAYRQQPPRREGVTEEGVAFGNAIRESLAGYQANNTRISESRLVLRSGALPIKKEEFTEAHSGMQAGYQKRIELLQDMSRDIRVFLVAQEKLAVEKPDEAIDAESRELLTTALDIARLSVRYAEKTAKQHKAEFSQIFDRA